MTSLLHYLPGKEQLPFGNAYRTTGYLVCAAAQSSFVLGDIVFAAI